MGHARERVAGALHGVTGFEQGLVEGLAVIGDENVEAGEVLGERVELRGFLVVIAHEELADAEAFATRCCRRR